MRAVNLIPADSRRGGQLGRSGGMAYVVLGLLAALLVLVVVYVSASNTINDRKAQVASLTAQLSAAQAEATRLAPYTDFAKLASARAETVRQIATSRFDWHRSLTDLSQVIPANTTLQALNASVSPGTGGGIALRSDIQAPAFELTGCTSSQDDVARLMSRLRVMTGVTRVSLQDSVKGTSQSAAVTAPTSGGGGGCSSNAPTFHIVVFFQPVPGAATSTAAAPTPTAGAAPAAATAAAPTPVATTSTTTPPSTGASK